MSSRPPETATLRLRSSILLHLPRDEEASMSSSNGSSPRLSSMSARNPQFDRSPSPPSSHYLNHPRSVPGTFVPPLPRKRFTPSGTWRPPSRPRTPSTHSPAPSLPHENPAVSHRPRANHPSSPPTVQTASPPGLGRGRPRNARNATLAGWPRGAGIGPPRCALDAPPPPNGKQPGGARPVGG